MAEKNSLIEIRWCGRGGQGTATAAKMFAESALVEGKFIQAFPEFGPERMGAPVKGFTRISSRPINIHCQITNPDISVLLDPTLIGIVDIVEGVAKDGVIIINTDETPSQLRQAMGLAGRKLYTVDATGIATKIIGKNLPGSAMMAAVVKATAVLKLETITKIFQQQYCHKFKDEVIRANIQAMRMAYEQTRAEDQKTQRLERDSDRRPYSGAGKRC